MVVQDIEKPIKYLIYGVVIFLVILMIAVTFGNNNANNTSTSTSTPQQASSQKQNEVLDDTDAYIQSQYYVKQILKAPATAEFPPLPLMVHHLKDSNRYEVVSYVDSQNSFGALLRSSWNVLFSYQDGKTYLEKMVFNGEVVYPVQNQLSEETQREIEKTQKLLDDLQKEIQSYK